MEVLDNIPKTLLIPLWARAKATLSNEEGCNDGFALAMLDTEEMDFRALEAMPPKMRQMMVTGVAVRSRLFDEAVLRFIQRFEQPVIINLGCGLDYRSHRLGDKSVQWYNVDVGSSHRIRRKLMPAADNVHELEGGIDDLAWLERIELAPGQQPMLISEGTLMYFGEPTIRQFLDAFSQRFSSHTGYLELVGDLVKGRVHPSVKAIGVDCPFQHGLRQPWQSFSAWLPAAKALAPVDNIYDHAPGQWGWLGWLFKLLPSWRYRLGSVMVEYDYEYKSPV